MRIYNHWDIAYRTKKNEPFHIVDQPPYGWTADPFLVWYRDEVFLFAEIFLYLSERNGVIGYCKYDGKGFGEWTVTMDRPWHLSYPYVFVKDDHLYMVPESYQLGEINLYRLESFPDYWVKETTYISNGEYCDSTFLRYKDGKDYMFTFERGEVSPEGKGYIFDVTEMGLSNKRLLSESLEGTRCGGKVLEEDGRYIRVGQDSTNEYGYGLIFYEIDSIMRDYSEHEIYRITPDDINVDAKSQKEYIGVHTYNKLGELEVIDLKFQSSTEEEEAASERVKKVFTNKY